MTDRTAPTRLRFGVLCSGPSLVRWQAECLQTLLATGLAEPALLILENPRIRRARLARKLRQTDRLLYNLYNTLVVKPLARSCRRAPGAALDDVPRLVCAPETHGPVQRFAAADIDAIRARRLDFIVRFGFGILTGEILNAARYGVWSYHHGDEQCFRGAAPAYWEIVRDEPSTGVLLQRLSERLDNGTVLFKGRFRTASTLARNLDRVYLGSADWLALVVKRVAHGDTGFLGAPAPRSTAPVLQAPGNTAFLRHLVRQAARLSRRLIRQTCFADVWNIGHASRSRQEVIAGMTTAGVRWATPAPGARYLADPMVITERRETKVYAEEHRYLGHGRLVSLSWPGGFAWDQARLECDLGRHASYPFVLEHESELWMVPESCALGKVILLRRSAAGRWEHAADLLEGVVLADPTLLRHGDRWWLFGADGRGLPHTRLLLFHAHNLTGPWRPHRLNPVKVDVAGARPAGPLFEVEGALYRPAQDCAANYGRAVRVHRVVELSPDAFAEEEVARIEPAREGAYPDGVHTLVVHNLGVFVDGKRLTFRPDLLPLRAARWLRERRQARAA